MREKQCFQKLKDLHEKFVKELTEREIEIDEGGKMDAKHKKSQI